MRAKPIVRKTSKGWFHVFDIMRGYRVWGTDRIIPESDGSIGKQTWLVGPYPTIEEAIAQFWMGTKTAHLTQPEGE